MPNIATRRNLRYEHGADRLVEDRLEPPLVERRALEVLDGPDLAGDGSALQRQNTNGERAESWYAEV